MNQLYVIIGILIFGVVVGGTIPAFIDKHTKFAQDQELSYDAQLEMMLRITIYRTTASVAEICAQLEQSLAPRDGKERPYKTYQLSPDSITYTHEEEHNSYAAQLDFQTRGNGVLGEFMFTRLKMSGDVSPHLREMWTLSQGVTEAFKAADRQVEISTKYKDAM
jgi:hypothetical protein